MKVEDLRKAEGTEYADSIDVGDGFEYDGNVYVRIDASKIADSQHAYVVHGMRIPYGTVEGFTRTCEVKPLTIRVQVCNHEG